LKERGQATLPDLFYFQASIVLIENSIEKVSPTLVA